MGLSGRDGVDTVVSLLGLRAEEEPETTAYSFVSDEGEQRVTYGELDRRARAIGCMLAGRRLQGAPVLLLYPSGIDYLAAFFGCLYAGVIAVPAYPPGRTRMENSQCWLADIARDAMPAAALMPGRHSYPSAASPRAVSQLSQLRVLFTDDLPEEHRWRPVAVAPDSIAVLHYTSGSTSIPKGVALTHRNLMSNAESVCRAFGHARRDRGVIWLPLYHGMGLISGVMQPLYGGFPLTSMAQADFLRRPLSWLEEISRVGATISGGPDFAYDLCVRKSSAEERARLDLSSWRVAFNGSEQVRAETMEKFADAFRVAGFRAEAFYPCYGLTESTSLIVGGAPWTKGATRSFDALGLRRGVAIPRVAGAGSRRLVSCGPVPRDHRVLVVDPGTGIERAATEIGEIWIAGDSAARSYWRRPEETRTTLLGRLTDTDEGPFVRSGDLGFVLDEQLYVVGTITDLIVTGDQSHQPQDIERTAERSSPVLRLGRGAVFLAVVGGEESVVAAHEVDRQAGAVNVADVAGAIRAAVLAEHGLQIHTVVLVAPGGIPRTPGGKIKRRLCAALFGQGKLAELGRSSVGRAADGGGRRLDRPGLLAVPERARRDLLREYLCRLIASACSMSEAKVADVPLRTLGVDSCAVMGIRQSIEADLGTHMTASDFAHATSIGDLAVRLDERLAIVTAPSWSGTHPFAEESSLWFLREIRPGSPEHCVAIALRLHGTLDPRALDYAVEALAARLVPASHTAARYDLTPLQWIAGTTERGWLRDGEAADADDTQLIASLESMAREPFDLARGPLLRIHRYQRASRETVLLIVAHRLIADSWSLTTFVRELEMLHAGQAGGTSTRLPQLADFVRHYSWISGSRVSGRERAETSVVVPELLPCAYHVVQLACAFAMLPYVVFERSGKCCPASLAGC
jgi:acyl-CoA synthetase (AMP-forming)/AMP-acid ligase II